MPPSLSVVVMTYDEAASLEAVVRELHSTLQGLVPELEILIVDDGSRDGTAQLADRLALAVPGVRVVRHPENRGLGGVYRTGFAEARGELVSFYPADGQFAAAILQGFLPLIEQHDFVLGYLPESRPTLAARALSWCEQLLYRGLFGPLPRFQGVMLFRRAVLERLPLRSQGRGWAVVMELLIRASRAGCRMRSEPTSLRPRRSGTSKVQNLRTVLSNLSQVLALRRGL